MKTISLEELKKKCDRHDDFKLVNALDRRRFRSMHIPGSINIFHKDDIKKFLKKSDEIVVYCTERACNVSILMYHLLKEMGYTKVRRFAGGLREWGEAGYPLETEYLSQKACL